TVMESFDPARVLHINLLTNITMVCDCWGFSSPSMVPDIGVMASHDMVAVERASVDAIKVENFIPGSLIGNTKLGEGKHLLEKVHGKDPYVQIDALERHGVGTSNYKIVEVK
ncbi:4Fe-4S ferredoxin, partial [bacterium]|nr:4Fe-4S ferredoxin [bacterium]